MSETNNEKQSMTENDLSALQEQVNELNRKVDLLLDYVREQRLKSEVVEDLVADVNIVVKDAFRSVVKELDERGCELDPGAIKYLFMGLLRNTKNFVLALETFESVVDFMKDAMPLVKESIIDLIHKLHEFEQKGYFTYLRELYSMLGEMHKHYSIDDLRKLSDNMGVMFSMVKNLTDAGFLKSLEKTTKVLSKVKMDDKLDDKSLFRLYKELKSPAVRKALSYTLRVIKETTETNNI